MEKAEEKEINLYEDMVDVLGTGKAEVKIKRLKIKRAMRLESFVYGSSANVKAKVRECFAVLDNMNLKNNMIWWSNTVNLDALSDTEIEEVKAFFTKYSFPVVIDKQKQIKIMR